MFIKLKLKGKLIMAFLFCSAFCAIAACLSIYLSKQSQKKTLKTIHSLSNEIDHQNSESQDLLFLTNSVKEVNSSLEKSSLDKVKAIVEEYNAQNSDSLAKLHELIYTKDKYLTETENINKFSNDNTVLLTSINKDVQTLAVSIKKKALQSQKQSQKKVNASLNTIKSKNEQTSSVIKAIMSVRYLSSEINVTLKNAILSDDLDFVRYTEKLIKTQFDNITEDMNAVPESDLKNKIKETLKELSSSSSNIIKIKEGIINNKIKADSISAELEKINTPLKNIRKFSMEILDEMDFSLAIETEESFEAFTKESDQTLKTTENSISKISQINSIQHNCDLIYELFNQLIKCEILDRLEFKEDQLHKNINESLATIAKIKTGSYKTIELNLKKLNENVSQTAKIRAALTQSHQSLKLIESDITLLIDNLSKSSKDKANKLKLFSEEVIEDTKADFTYWFKVLIIILASSLIIAFLIAIFISNRIGKQLSITMNVIDAVKSGDLSKEIKINKGNDELAQMNNNLRLMTKSLQKKADLTAEISKGNLTVDVPLDSPADTLGISLQSMLKNLNSLVYDVKTNSDKVKEESINLSSSSQIVSENAELQSNSVKDITGVLNQLLDQANKNLESSKVAKELSTKASNSTKKGHQQMLSMVDAMEDVSEASEKINSFINVIDEIAFQTNLLALNAAVEAARAGKHGLGFSIVASEVRNLATRTSKVANQSSQMITETIQKIRNGQDVAKQTSEYLQTTLEQVNLTNDHVSEINQSSENQAANIQQINDEIRKIKEKLDEGLIHTHSSSALASDMEKISVKLRSLLDQFTIKENEEDLSPFIPEMSNNDLEPLQNSFETIEGF